MSTFDKAFLDKKCKEIRKELLKSICSIGAGHVGGCLSCIEIVTVLHNAVMENTDPKNPKKEGRDRLVISKGHAGPTLYAVLADRGYFPKDWLSTLNKLGTHLPSHTDMNHTPGVDMTAGSLGQGLSCAVGLAYGSKLKNDNATIYALIGDGESQEGQIWEAGLIANQKNLGNLVVFTDYNKMQIDGPVDKVITLEPIHEKWKAFGWNVIDVADGNDTQQVYDAALKAKELGRVTGKPVMIIANTVKGKGYSVAEKLAHGCHHMAVTKEMLEEALHELS